ncbi:conserved exported hypothetical protein [Candidatus Sulfopaludibacter sp. SbA3]|nr:conserved exported hypothetical protein [Candidatus Sulfopaludibacter sp. SbA3]
MFGHKSGNPVTRREALCRVGSGFGMMAFAGMVGQSLAHAGVDTPGGAATLDYPQKVKRVIFLFMNGGLSHVDSFDPKPMLEKYDGQPLPGGTIKTERRTGELMKSPFKFKKYGQCGMDVSELWPHLGEVADDICWVRSVYTDIPNHEPSCLMLNTGANQAGRPSMGAWLTYGLGTENQNLPGYVVLCPNVPTTVGPPLWSNGFLPAIHQGTYISNRVGAAPGQEDPEADPMPEEKADDKDAKDKDGKEKPKKVTIERNFDPKKLVSYVNNPKFSLVQQRRELDLLEKLEKMREEQTGTDQQVEASIKSMEIAYRMQTEAPEVFDVRKESQATLDLYGPGPVARGCLTAVRLAQKGVRMTQVYYSQGDPWDAHGDILRRHFRAQDQRQEFRSRVRGGDQGSEEPRIVEGHAGSVRVGVRPNSGAGSGRSGRGHQARARPQSIWIHHVAGGRRGERRHHLRRHRRLWIQGDREAGARARYSRHDLVPVWNRSYQADLSV